MGPAAKLKLWIATKRPCSFAAFHSSGCISPSCGVQRCWSPGQSDSKAKADPTKVWTSHTKPKSHEITKRADRHRRCARLDPKRDKTWRLSSCTPSGTVQEIPAPYAEVWRQARFVAGRQLAHCATGRPLLRAGPPWPSFRCRVVR